ncbi:peroxisomal membrane protein PEX14 [Rhododendron vialii]|uniref:peroxisomal membrane protein PEX14 n=1 Tax=Rhododendron vialii TaxID=182163 RepID=UPI00265FE97C|nr:peroxisomal membrane protein PEX14 [Rhododendron vialii]
MATQPDDKPQNPASEVVQTAIEDRHDTMADANGGISPTSVFVNSEPMREEQVQNAVKFLSHPKVRGSPVMYRRSFLEKKGLTKEEIDEAFRRVPDPDPPQNVSSAQPAGSIQDGQMKSSSNVQPLVSTQTLQPLAASPSGVISTMTQSRFRWSYALLAVGFLAVSGAGTAVLFKNAIVPRLKSWIRKVVHEEEEKSSKKTDSKPSLEQEATAAAKAAAAAAAEVARASQEMLISKTEEKKCFEELVNLIGVQVQEMKSMSNAIQKLEVQGNAPGRTPLVEEQDHRVLAKSSRQQMANGTANFDLYSGRSSSPPTTVEPSAAPHPKSYMEIMAMVQRGEKPPNVREINDLPPNPNQPLPNPHVAPRAKPWEVSQPQNISSQVFQSQESSYGLNYNLQDNVLLNQSNGDSSVPWWQRKNVRISEIEHEDEFKSGSSGTLTHERTAQRSWVPPQPPPVAMPEAAAAIRQPKKPLSQKQVADDQLVANPPDVTDELQRITKISESGGVPDANGGTLCLNGVNGLLSESEGVVNANGGSLGLATSEIQELEA